MPELALARPMISRRHSPLATFAARLSAVVTAASGGVCSLLLGTTAALAQDGPIDLPLAEILALHAQAFDSREGFAGALARVLPGVVIAPGGSGPEESGPGAEDPFLWSLSGSFGGPVAGLRPGAIFGCARYGLATRDLFAEQGFSTQSTFALMGALRPQPDDAAVWPEGAVARLWCGFVWDDAETVRILPEARARAVLGALFERVEDPPGDARLLLPLLGAEGFDLTGRSGAEGLSAGAVVWLESGEVILTLGHQSVAFRAFLRGGGV